MDSGQRTRRHDVLELCRLAGEPVTARQVADELGMHLNTARFHLDTLVRQRVLRRESSAAAGPGRPAVRYSPVPGMDREGSRNWRLLAEILLSHVATHGNGQVVAETAGEAWGRYLVTKVPPGHHVSVGEAADRLTQLLAEIGFAPVYVRDAARPRMELRHCPFLELAEAHQELVCSLHLGLIRGALAEVGDCLTVETLVPFARPDTCLAQLSIARDSPP